MTYEELLARALSKVPNDVDKREGSLIFYAIAPACFELSQCYIELEILTNRMFIDTAESEDLTRRCNEIGVYRKGATCAIRKGVFNINIPLQSRFGIEDTTYIAISKIADFQYELQCEQGGSIGNTYSGTLLPISYISGLETAILTEILITGQDEESDHNLRNRYYDYVQRPATSGNVHHYRQWTLEVEGVGDCKVYPLWDGPGTVKVLVLNSEKEIDITLESVVSEHIETVRPIGATVTVQSPTSKVIDVVANVVLNNSVFLGAVQQDFAEKINEYFKGITFKSSVISYAIVGSLLLTIEGVADYSDLKLNGSTSNIIIGDEEIPVLGNVSLEVI